jgi:hypothetical protein
MKRYSFIVVALIALLAAMVLPGFAADEKGKEVTIIGMGTCAKCALHETDKCQTVIQTEGENGKPLTYYLTQNDVAKDFHENVCKEPHKVVATGTVSKKHGKEMLTVTKIELAK